MKTIKLSYKLSFLVISLLLASVVSLWIYFDNFLKDADFQQTQKQIDHAYKRFASDINTISVNLKDGVAFIDSDEDFFASVELINNYQNKENYNAALLDEEKKIIADKLLQKVKFSFNDNIALYDENEELLVFVNKEDKGYKQYFYSYEKTQKKLYSKYENEDTYSLDSLRERELNAFKHIVYYENNKVKDFAVITRHIFNGELYILSHHSVYDYEKKKVLAHLEMSHKVGKDYFAAFSENLNIKMKTSENNFTDKDYVMFSDDGGPQRLQVKQTETVYYALVKLKTKSGDFNLKIELNKDKLESNLEQNREEILVFIIFILLLIPILLSYIFKRWLANPIDKLLQQISMVEKMDYSKSMAVCTGDELEIISKNINTLAMTIQDRENALKKSQENFEYLSTHDALTNVPNIRLYIINLEAALKRAKRNGTKVAVIFIDLDEFKNINDTLGHNVGDELLQEVAKRLQNNIRESDSIARIGGDEFNIFLEDIHSVEEIQSVADKIVGSFGEIFYCGENEIRTTASIGISIYPDDGQDSTTLIKNADLAMYKSKDEGKNSYSLFSNKLADALYERTKLITALKEAIEFKEQFYLLYQPKISLQSNKIVALEALVRWNSPSLGFVMPNQFIKIAEETNMIIPIGEWVLEQACKDFVLLKQEGCMLEHISVNVSGIQLKNSDMEKTIISVLNATGMKPVNLELEITESYIATNEEKAIQTLQKFREIGVNLAIDDFGTGYSSLSYLQKLPVTRLKIDKSFIDNISFSQESSAIVKAIIVLAKIFNLHITAEGVETQEQVDFLREQECDEIQGYFYFKPLGLDDVKKFCTRSRN
ncbi:MAG: EAL domain-containing protein [Sulfurimonas sp.]|nr:EAL domain-containing protein [Sulfurimonas sp.]MBU3938080.1 EAL domain-containing protein [bacterium]MBU4023767.1 EAL domain-containing protein [bacterium]MBU4058427.1 EAL domain-containing protein [bacterium]